MSTDTARLPLAEIESRLCDIAGEELGIRRSDIHPDLRLIQDLHCDSLALVELILHIEDAFDVTLPDEPQDMVHKSVFTRDPIRLRDLAELVYLRQGSGKPKRDRDGRLDMRSTPPRLENPFTQLGWQCVPCD